MFTTTGIRACTITPIHSDRPGGRQEILARLAVFGAALELSGLKLDDAVRL